MAKTYFLSADTATHSLGSQFTTLLDQNVDVITTVSITADDNGAVDNGYYEENEDTGVTRTSTGTFGVEVNISTARADTQMRTRLHRVNASGSIQASSSYTGYQATTSTGLLNFSHVDPGLGTWLSDDRLAVELEVQNNAPHGGFKGPTHDQETVNAEVTTPFTDAAGPGITPVNFQKLARGLGAGMLGGMR